MAERSDAAMNANDDLQLKVMPPRVPRHLVTRSRLLSSDARLAGQPVLLVQAPAGFGKTSLMAQWRLEHLARGAVVAWVLAQAQDSPKRLLQALVLAVRSGAARPAFGRTLLDSPSANGIEGVTAWLAEVAQTALDVVLFVDEVERLPEDIARAAGLPAAQRAAQPARDAGRAQRLPPGHRRPGRLRSVHGGRPRAAALAVRRNAGAGAQALRRAHRRRCRRPPARADRRLAAGAATGAVGHRQRRRCAPGGAVARCAGRRAARAFRRAAAGQPGRGRRVLPDPHRHARPAAPRTVPCGDGPRRRGRAPGAAGARHAGVRRRRRPRLAAHAQPRARRAARALHRPAGRRAGGDACARRRLAGRAGPARGCRRPCAGRRAARTRLRSRRTQPVRIADDARAPGQRARMAGAAAARGTGPAPAPAAGRGLVARAERTPRRGRAPGGAHPGATRGRCRAEMRMRADPQRCGGVRRRPGPLRRTARPLGRGAAAARSAAAEDSCQPLGLSHAARRRARASAAAPATGAARRVATGAGLCQPLGRLHRRPELPVGRAGAAGREAVAPGAGAGRDRPGAARPFAAMLAALLAAAMWERNQPAEATALLANRLDVLERSGLPETVLLGYRTAARAAAAEGAEHRALELLDAMHAVGVARRLPRLCVASLADQVRLHARRFRAGNLPRPVRAASTCWSPTRAAAGPAVAAQRRAAARGGAGPRRHRGARNGAERSNRWRAPTRWRSSSSRAACTSSCWACAPSCSTAAARTLGRPAARSRRPGADLWPAARLRRCPPDARRLGASGAAMRRTWLPRAGPLAAPMRAPHRPPMRRGCARRRAWR